eukprot:CAMPEP_0184872488 /NCGR_PEP_ID=MMETSP0580-20130426/41316_1 /TAXON_ID=1118495 /ORGANISM="Dactyliosolen fragilissimus" /LENGTH=556 /DNA_ID=CAMNT_0027375293 /DNA_START=162 /DNA_END=1832 /DNA_ORIENTATION=+
MASSSSSEEENAEQVRISLIPAKGSNAYEDESLHVPSDPIAVPSDIRRKGLSALVNHLLGRIVPGDDGKEEESDEEDDAERLPAIPFDFLLNGRLLRTGVEIGARRLGLSLEKAVELQYFPSHPAPTDDGESESAPDWITSMCHSRYDDSLVQSVQGRRGIVDGLLCAGGNDGVLTVYDTGESLLIDGGHHQNSTGKEKKSVSFRQADSIKAHSGPLKCMDSLSVSDSAKQMSTTLIASGSTDQTLVSHIFSCSHQNAEEDSSSKERLALHAVYSGGHSATISSVALSCNNNQQQQQHNTKSTLLASGDWNGMLCLWDTGFSVNNTDADKENEHLSQEEEAWNKNAVVTKKRRTTAGSTTTSNTVREIEPILTFGAHSNNLSGICWGHSSTNNVSNTLITCSWDHSIKSWDVESQNIKLTLNGSKVIACMGRSHEADLVATGHPDCTVRLWDMRTQGTGQQVGGGGDSGTMGSISDSSLLPSHKAWVTSVQWSPNNPFLLASSSHDGTVKVWDIRSSLPLHTTRAHPKGSKALCMAYDKRAIYSGGSDCIVKRFKC